MTPEKTFELINNFDIREPIRKYSFKYSSIIVSSDGEIIDVVRYKEQPTDQMDLENLKKHPKCFLIHAFPGWYKSVEELKARLQEDVILNRMY